MDDNMNGAVGLGVFLRELDIRVADGGAGGNSNVRKPQTDRLYATIIHKLQVAAAAVYAPRRGRVTLFNSIQRIIDSAFPNLAKDDIVAAPGQQEGQTDKKRQSSTHGNLPFKGFNVTTPWPRAKANG